MIKDSHSSVKERNLMQIKQLFESLLNLFHQMPLYDENTSLYNFIELVLYKLD